MATLNYHLLDVFTETPFGGNQLAVFLDAEGLSDEMMQTVARELNLSESVFVLPSDKADFRLRIFTPAMELPMAGHPTVGAADVLRREGLLPESGEASFEEGVGIIPLALDESGVYMSQPTPEFGAIREDSHAIAEMLSLETHDLLPGYPIQAISSGVPFTFIPIVSVEAIDRIQFRPDVWDSILKGFEAPHVFTFTPELERGVVRSRMFAPMMGIPEDPATGAASGPLGAYLVEHGLVNGGGIVNILSKQGYAMGRPSQINIRITRNGKNFSKVEVGGKSVYMGSGQLLIPD